MIWYCKNDEYLFPDSMDTWRNNRKRGVWFKVHLNQCDWVPILIKVNKR